MDKLVSWSFSSLKDFTKCPRKYHETKVLRNYKTSETQAIIYGKEVHTACELYIEKGTELPERFSQFDSMMKALNNIDGTKLTEYQFALDKDRKPCGFESKDMWVRGIVDLLIIDGDLAYIVDYKTGNDRFADTDQLKLMAIMAFYHFPKIKNIKACLLFMVKNRIIKETYERKDLEKLWERFEINLYKLRQSFASGTWNPNPTPLCKWCPVESCEYNPEH
tara:strand:+ start:9366 stop:10028 length:663 start_codon:yes stop_codon:yes gene_type:complete